MGTSYMSTGGSTDAQAAAKFRETRRRRNENRPPKTHVAAAGEVRTPAIETSDPGVGGKRSRSDCGEDASDEDRRPAAPSPSLTLSLGGGGADDESGSAIPAKDRPVLFGSMSSIGRSREMEDSVSIRPYFFRPGFAPPLHFFAVFDGHGGPQVASLCKERMHEILAEELTEKSSSTPSDSESLLRSALVRSFARMDDLALSVCACGKVGLPLCQCVRSGFESEIIGSTAVVAIVGGGLILVANCGDSRAVLSRGGRAVPLSADHKPDRLDELARITAAGGRVIYHNGARVHGILAMSRALGDRYLKPEVISEPEFCVVERSDEDECLIIASDGLWDVMPNDLACDVARRCLGEARRDVEDTCNGQLIDNVGYQGEEQASDTRCTLAATLLARLALGRQTADNISIIVIDLRRK